MASMVVLLTAGSDIEFASRHVNNVLVIRENARKLVSKDENKRAEGMDYLIRAKVGEANGERAQLLIARMKDIARESPEKSLELAEMLANLKNPSNGSLNLAAAPAAGVMGALAFALVYSVATPQVQENMRDAVGSVASPETQENMRNTANSVVESAKKAGGAAKEEVQKQLKISIGLWEFITLTAFPIHLLDDENRKLVNPIVDTSGGNPASGGYAEGGGVITTPHTGGTQLDGVQKDGAYVTPEHKLNPGVMYSEGGTGKGDATIIDSAILAQRVMDARAGLPSDLRRGGNVAVADIDIPGISRQMAAHSGISVAGRGFIGEGSGNFVAQIVPNKAGDPVYRGTDSEYKILDNIADQLGGNRAVSGAVNIFTEKPACVSCLGAGEQFNEIYPNITVNFIDNQGVMLRPPRRIP
ncbi:deaminase domain-containing protein [Pseudomonas protegens]|uniref:deaminase domain-containing protein n=5 Tax=Pseudomonas protegens TaxID=380021 RepID=UPI001B3248E7|nr:deaminase domain-containing protein [Pseudomonas protegens]MBP5150622.1 hypothetical protein [Pseudomonas protegens]